MKTVKVIGCLGGFVGILALYMPVLSQVTKPVRAVKGEGKAAAPVVKRDELVIRKFLEDNVNDATRLEIVEISEPYALENCWYWNGGDQRDDRDARELGFQGETTWRPFRARGTVYVVKFRASNDVGATVLLQRAFILQKAKVSTVIRADFFSPERPVQREDPYLQQFESQFEFKR